MILQALVKEYEILQKQGKIPKLGIEWGNVSYQLNIDIDGELLDIVSLKEEVGDKKKRLIPRKLQIPMQVKRASGTKSNFLCDNSSYVLGLDNKGKPEQAREHFSAFKNLHNELLENCTSENAQAILKFLNNWNPDNATEFEPIRRNYDEIIKGGNILLSVEGKPCTEDMEIAECWDKYFNSTESDDNAEKCFCSVTGQVSPVAVLHPIIKGVYGAQAMGTSLVSYNADAFCSYNKEKGENASVGKYASIAYTSALNYLLGDKDHTKHIGDTTIVCWAESGEEEYQYFAWNYLLQDFESNKISESDFIAIVDKIVKGEKVEIDNFELDPKLNFYILGVSPNAARLSVRFFIRQSFGKFLDNIKNHYSRLEIVRPSYDTLTTISPLQMFLETVNKNSKDKKLETKMVADTMTAIFTGGLYPASLLNNVMIRIRAEHNVTRRKAAIIKAYYSRNENKDCPEEVLKVALNEKSKDVSYNLGRLFAVLENIQEAANPGINATIKDRYFNTASSTPANVFPVLINLSQKHLKQINNVGKIRSFEISIQEIVSNLEEELPKRLNIPEQGSFQLGYYHQRQKLFTKKEDKTNE